LATNSLLDTFNISSKAKISKHNINSKAVLQKRQRREEREERVYLSDMSPTAIFNRFLPKICYCKTPFFAFTRLWVRVLSLKD
jgi:hypothetical protein